MNDHLRWQTLAATRIDFGLQDDEETALVEHQAGCAECRVVSQGLRADAQGLRMLDFGPTPARLRIRVAERGVAMGRDGPSLGALLIAAVLLLIVTLAGSIAVGALLNQRPSAPDLEGNQVNWKTEVVNLQAADFWIDTAGKRFLGTGQLRVSSDPGNATYRTLELTWLEHGAEMRVNIYFGGDATHWWIEEIRTYDGTAQSPDWLFYRAPEIRAPIGQPWIGNVHLTSIGSSQPGRGPGTLHFGTMRLASMPRNVLDAPPDGPIVVPIPGASPATPVSP